MSDSSQGMGWWQASDGKWYPPASAPTPAPPPPPPPPPQWGQQPGYSPYPNYGGYTAPKNDGTAVTALVLAIASFVVCPVIPSIVALVLANSADRNIAASNGALTGESLTRAARIIAWIHLGLIAVVIVLIVLFGIIGAASSSSGY